MDGQHPPNINGNSKNIIPGVPGGNMFLPSLFSQPQIPTTSTHTTNAADLPWAKNQMLQNWVDTQAKNLPNMYNMFAGNMASNGSFAPNLDNSWQNSSQSQSNLNLANPLLAAFQQQYAGGKAVNNSNSSSLNPLLGSSHLRQPSSSSSFDPLHPTPSAINPPISQPKQPPKHPTNSSLFPSLPSTSSYGTQDSSKINNFSFPPGYDQLRDLMSGHLGGSQSFNQSSQQQHPFNVQQPQAPIARPQPRPAAAAAAPPSGIPPQTFDLLSSVAATVKSSKSDRGFDLSQILPSTASMSSLLSPQMPSTSTAMPSIFPQQTPSNMHGHTSIPSTSGNGASGYNQLHHPGSSSMTASAPSLQIPSTSSLAVPPNDCTLISPRSGKRRSGGQNGDLARPPSEGGLDLDLDDINLFDGMNEKDQEALFNSTLNFDEICSAIPTSSADEPHPPPPPKPVEPPPKPEEPKKEVSSASSKMELLMARLKKSRAAAPPPPAAAAAAPAVHAAPVAAAVAAVEPKPATPAAPSPAILQKPATPLEKGDKLSFTPPLSPVDLSDPSKPSTSGISSLIAASILPSELMMGRSDTANRKKTVPVYMQPKATQQSSAIPIYKQKEQKSFIDSKDDEFAFTDEDPEETNEKLKKDDESEEEPERHAPEAKGGDKDGGMKYITKIGFDLKEGEKEQKMKQESKKPAPVFPGRDRHARQESLEFAERLRKRRKEIVSVDFANVLQCEHNQCAIDSVQKNVEDADKPPLPRLLIRLPKKSMDGAEEKSRRRKKKRRYYDDAEESEEDDDDWYGGRPKKRRGRKPKRELNPEETYSVRLVDPSTIEHARKEVHIRPIEYKSKKDKFLRNWRDEHAGQEDPPVASGRGVEGKIEPKSLTKIVTEYKNTEARERLEKFKHCSGFTPRGTFLVLKAEINTPDCALWRVDNMNLLQKFPGFLGRTEPGGPKKLLYKNSSTYSGWCEQLQPGYMVIEVRHVKQTRSECVVEPLIHVDELFPAISEELNERYCVPSLKALISKEDVTAQAEARNFILKDDVRNGLYMVIRNMLDGALSFDYFSKAQQPTIGGLSNPSFELLDEMECQIRECEETIKDRISFDLNFEKNLKMYASCLAIACDLSEVDCQACGEAHVEKTLQLFDLHIENEKKGEEEEDFYYDPATLLPAVDFLVCAECCKLALWHHQLIHFRNDLAKRIEDRLLEATLEMPSLVPEQIVDNLRQCYTWLKEMIVTHTDTWDSIMKSDEEPEEEAKPAVAEVAAAAKEEPATKIDAAVPPALPIAVAAEPIKSEDVVDDDDDTLIDPVTL